ncbi:CapA family protein [Paenibacillaceae bacterium WGS1546]|uniref:CapA family protein n=1 Tax=Cohnella sp. WGS1546 TaxID=3366810 RepID=UPI00372D4F50
MSGRPLHRGSRSSIAHAAARLIAIGLVSALLAACANGSPAAPPPSAGASSSPGPGSTATPSASAIPDTPSPVPPEPIVTEAVLFAVGDIMVHMPQLPAYYDPATGRYDLTPWFAQVKPIFAQGDWVIGNLETPIAGRDLKYTGYPRFNAPDELAEAIADAGIRIVSTANNHSLDRGVPGVQRTLGTVRKAGLVPVGTSVSLTDSKRAVIEERNGIRMGFLAYSYGTNGIPLPADRSYAVNLIEPEAIKRDIAKLRQAGADAVTVSLHYGVEYQRQPNAQQTGLARELVAAGADLILGSHAHVVQPYETIDVPATESADGRPRQGVAIYSLGNFISNQTGDWKDVGVIFGVRVQKTAHPDGTADIELLEVSAEPTWVRIQRKKDKRHYTIIPLRDAVERKLEADFTPQEYARMEKMLNGLDKHLRSLQPK